MTVNPPFETDLNETQQSPYTINKSQVCTNIHPTFYNLEANNLKVMVNASIETGLNERKQLPNTINESPVYTNIPPTFYNLEANNPNVMLNAPFETGLNKTNNHQTPLTKVKFVLTSLQLSITWKPTIQTLHSMHQLKQV